MSSGRWIALRCGEETAALVAQHPSAFLLLTVCAVRAKWKDCPITGLKEGQALIGDWKKAGLASEKSYRHAKKILSVCGIAAFQGTSKGTVATLRNSTIYSLSPSAKGGQTDEAGADQGRTRGEPGATNHTDTQNTLTQDSCSDGVRRKKSKVRKGSPRGSVQCNSPAMTLIGSWFGRDATDLWEIKEAASLKTIQLKAKDLQVLDAYYRLPREQMVALNGGDFRRRQLPTLLNNWTGDCDTARGFVADHGLEVRDLSAVLNPQPDLLPP